ncbi:hypothetical protein [Bradyrhizobium japonicum]|uniref:hypothetical protein n=1 Tax=Bradyrhizobium japonicum TaxID=375 RepID=UPI001BAB18C3|nr:hypothetical protein [Bradyrhizobium japonicum]MBR0911496.1 hypothetical protein [Bradyrhizobium japonicum]
MTGKSIGIWGFILTAVLGAIAHPSWAKELSQQDLQDLLRGYSQLSPKERAELKGPVEAALARLKKNPASRRAPAALPVDVRSANAAATPKAIDLKKDNDIKTEFLIRESYAPIAYITLDGDLSDNGASFTYTRNLANKFDTFVGNGAVLMAVHGNTNLNYTGDPNKARITYFNFAPGIEFDTTLSKGTMTGSISAMAAFEAEIQGGGPIPMQYLRTNATYTTDYDQQARIYGLESMWQPWAPDWFIGSSFRANEALGMWVSFFPTLASDYYRVENAGTFDQLKNRDYLWAGTKMSGNVWFDKGFLKPFSFYLRYYYLYDVLHPSHNEVNYFQGGMKYKLTPDGRIALDFRYTNGTTLRTLNWKNEFYTGLTVKIGELQTSGDVPN